MGPDPVLPARGHTSVLGEQGLGDPQLVLGTEVGEGNPVPEADQEALKGLVEAISSSEYQAARKMLSSRASVVRTPLDDI